MIEVTLYVKPATGSAEYLVLEKDWQQYLDPRMRAVLLELAWWVDWKFKKKLLVTCMCRNKSENAAVGGLELSSHLSGRASDLRSMIYTAEELEAIQQHLLDTWGADFLCVQMRIHGTGPHIHVNINYPYARGSYGRPEEGATNG